MTDGAIRTSCDSCRPDRERLRNRIRNITPERRAYKRQWRNTPHAREYTQKWKSLPDINNLDLQLLVVKKHLSKRRWREAMTMAMSVEIIPASRLSQLASLSTDELRSRLAQALALTAESLLEMACIIRTLEDRGEDLHELKLGILPLLRKIAHGQVLPELVAKYSSNAVLLRYATTLPIPDQQRIASGEPLRVLILNPDGTTDARRVEPHKLSTRDMPQVFAADHIRDEGEQVSYIRSRKPTTAAKDDSGVVVDTRRQGLHIGGKFYSCSDLMMYISRAMGKN
jgi:hypothetical protein